MTKTSMEADFNVLRQPYAHSTLCWKTIQEIFHPFTRLWIVLENGEREATKQLVLNCPSGALKWIEKLHSQKVIWLQIQRIMKYFMVNTKQMGL